MLSLLGASPVHAAEGPWKPHSQRGALVLERREVPGSKYYELRVRTTSTASPAEVLEALWSGLKEDLPATIKKRMFLRDAGDELLFYDQIRTPVVSDRDYTIRLRRTVTAEKISIVFDTANDAGPPPAPGHVRVPAVHGGWSMTPRPDGGAQLEYRVYSEPGGAIPAFLARGAQVDEAYRDVERILARAEKRRRRR